MTQCRLLSTSESLDELNDVLRAWPEREAAVARTLALFDPLNHAPAVRANTLLVEGDGAEWCAPLAGALGGYAERYQLTHQGGTDNDSLDAWLAARLRVTAMSRFLREVG